MTHGDAQEPHTYSTYISRLISLAAIRARSICLFKVLSEMFQHWSRRKTTHWWTNPSMYVWPNGFVRGDFWWFHSWRSWGSQIDFWRISQWVTTVCGLWSEEIPTEEVTESWKNTPSNKSIRVNKLKKATCCHRVQCWMTRWRVVGPSDSATILCHILECFFSTRIPRWPSMTLDGEATIIYNNDVSGFVCEGDGCNL